MDKLLPHQNFSLEDMEGEIWKDIEGYEGYYQISSFGRVKSLSRNIFNGHGYYISKEKILRITVEITNYTSVGLSINNKRKGKLVHRLVALNFIPNLFNKPQINHKNSIKNDNNINNLEWVSALENNCHREIKNKTSLYTGVSFKKRNKKWSSRIMIKNKKIHLGVFKTQEEAYEARCNYEKNNNIENKYL
jgi:hypothetical protein